MLYFGNGLLIVIRLGLPHPSGAKADVFDYIEVFYNGKRRHSAIGYLSPILSTELAAVQSERS